jgi:uncharacterized protein (DUF1684 family)
MFLASLPVGCHPDAAEYRADFEAYHAARLARLTAPDGWLSLTGLFWLEEPGEYAFGGDPSNRLVFPGEAPARIGTFTLTDTSVTMRASPAMGVTVDGEPVSEILMQDDEHETPTVARLGTMSWVAIQRSRGIGIRLRDTASPVRRDFEGIETFPPDPRWRIEARFEPFEQPRRVFVPSITGTPEEDISPGMVAFEIDGQTYRLSVTGRPGAAEYFLVFGDATSGHETYGGGRFVYLPAPNADGFTIVDFNRAYNPPCVFTPYATCPLPTPENRLPVRIEAGEKNWGDDHV